VQEYFPAFGGLGANLGWCRKVCSPCPAAATLLFRGTPVIIPAALSEAGSAETEAGTFRCPPQPFSAIPPAGMQSFRLHCTAHPAQDYRASVSAPSRPTPAQQNERRLILRPGKRFSFGPCTARFLCRKQRKWGVQNPVRQVLPQLSSCLVKQSIRSTPSHLRRRRTDTVPGRPPRRPPARSPGPRRRTPA